MKNALKNQTGQVAILVMLVLVVALTVGLSVAARTLSNIRQSTNTENANRAYSAAEAGIEDALRSSTTATGNKVTIGTGSTAVSYTVATPGPQGGGTSAYAFPNPVKRDEVSQLWLFNYDSYKNTNTLPALGATPKNYYNEQTSPAITVYWGSNNTTPKPALEAAFIFKDSTGFGIDKCALDPDGTRASSNNFDYPGMSTTPTCALSGSFTSTGAAIPVNGKNYYYSKTFTLPNPGGSNKVYLLLRLKLLIYNTSGSTTGIDTAHEIAIQPLNGTSLPQQGQVIDSQGESGNVIRKIRVYQSYPTLPGIFDFVLFNGSDNPLQK